MGKRSAFARLPQDRYDTPAKAVVPLLPHLPPGATYYEPCHGNGALVRALPLRCVGHSDAELDARSTRYETDADFFITNPPFRRDLLHFIIENLRTQRPTWLLLDSDWMFTRQASRLMTYCQRIVAVGRVISSAMAFLMARSRRCLSSAMACPTLSYKATRAGASGASCSRIRASIHLIQASVLFVAGGCWCAACSSALASAVMANPSIANRIPQHNAAAP